MSKVKFSFLFLDFLVTCLQQLQDHLHVGYTLYLRSLPEEYDDVRDFGRDESEVEAGKDSGALVVAQRDKKYILEIYSFQNLEFKTGFSVLIEFLG